MTSLFPDYQTNNRLTNKQNILHVEHFTEERFTLNIEYCRCLQSMIDGCGPMFNAFIDQDMLDLIFTALTHTNRFVRETGYYVCSSLVSCNTTQGTQHL